MKNTGNQNDVENERKDNFDDEEEEDIDILMGKIYNFILVIVFIYIKDIILIF